MLENLWDIRYWLERIAEDHGFPRNLAGLCAVSAAKVHLRMRRLGYKSRIIYNESHCFNYVNGQLVDCTASQFDLPDVYVGNFPDGRWFYEVGRVFYKVADLYYFQRQNGWGENQILDRYIKKAHPRNG